MTERERKLQGLMQLYTAAALKIDAALRVIYRCAMNRTEMVETSQWSVLLHTVAHVSYHTA